MSDTAPPTTPDTTPDTVTHGAWRFAQDARGGLLPATTPEVSWYLSRARQDRSAVWHPVGQVDIPASGRWTVRQLAAALGSFVPLPETWLEAIASADAETGGVEPLY